VESPQKYVYSVNTFTNDFTFSCALAEFFFFFISIEQVEDRAGDAWSQEVDQAAGSARPTGRCSMKAAILQPHLWAF